jgi:hypothetical protein
MKTILILVTSMLTGCATQHTLNGWDYGTALLDKGPVVYQMSQSPSNGVSDIRTSTSTVITNNSTFVVNRVGNTVSVIQSGKR